jgi:hypothetical protein
VIRTAARFALVPMIAAAMIIAGLCQLFEDIFTWAKDE